MSLIEKLRNHDFWNTPEDESESLLVEAADALTAQAERVRVLEEENQQLKICLKVAEKLYRETLGTCSDSYG